MKTCYMCGGDVERRIVEVEGVIVKDVPVEVCTRCGEQYYNTKAATFVQKITRYVNDAKKNLREAVEGYVKSVVRDDEEDDFIPRPVPDKTGF